eukprot:1143202-Pelagomonas_calceolata.AAC.12
MHGKGKDENAWLCILYSAALHVSQCPERLAWISRYQKTQKVTGENNPRFGRKFDFVMIRADSTLFFTVHQKDGEQPKSMFKKRKWNDSRIIENTGGETDAYRALTFAFFPCLLTHQCMCIKYCSSGHQGSCCHHVSCTAHSQLPPSICLDIAFECGIEAVCLPADVCFMQVLVVQQAIF